MQTKKSIRNLILIFLVISISFSFIGLFLYHEMKDKIENANTLNCEVVSDEKGEFQTICDDKELNEFIKLLINYRVYYFFLPFFTLIVFVENTAVKLILILLNIIYFLFLAIIFQKLIKRIKNKSSQS